MKAGKVRKAILEQLGNTPGLTPSEMGRLLDLTPPEVSRGLSDLSGKGLVRCLNPSRRKGRIYAVTKLGATTLKRLT